MSFFVAGMEPAGSPERMTFSTLLAARSIPSALASWAMRSAYVGVEATTVAPVSTIWFTR